MLSFVTKNSHSLCDRGRWAFLSGRGLGIRLLVDEPPDERCSAELQNMVARLCLVPSRTDLILDMGAVMDGDETVKDAIAALDLLGTLLPWRMVVLTSGAFPRFHEERGRPSAYEVRRHDLDPNRGFRGAEYGDGERWLHECAAGEGAKGSGNPETWIRVGHLQHMAFAVNQLSQGG
ncbi:hypothetical protein ACFWPQ_05785 [Streptomyces sp. NPDC058464]|uniref:beta family protein n=1 Tax=Streptomyces sp. NPDC058464 TaxID=3346511 RepID=UPI0036677F76